MLPCCDIVSNSRWKPLHYRSMESDYQTRWEVLPAAPAEYLSAADLHPLIAQLLYNHGVKIGEIEPFLAADHRLAGNPFLLSDMAQAVSRIYKALLAGERIAIYGDFDVDGITATASLAEGLSWLGGKITLYIPDRLQEGHGLRLPAIEKLRDQGIDLIITVDCGVTSLTEAKQAREIGIDMIITDHHMPLETLPQAVAVIDPKRKDSGYPFRDLAGVGVAFKLLQALFHKDSREKSLMGFLDLVALGTVTDVVPLVGENRYLVKEGLKALNNTTRVGLQEMVRLARLELGKLDTESISWVLGPRLNTASRMDHAATSYRLLTTNSLEEAQQLAAKLEGKNAERQRLTSGVLSKVKEKLTTKMHLPLLMEGDESYPVGVIGLVAGKLVDEFCKPAIVINLGSELCRGSARSIPQFNLAAALEQCQDLLTTFGGHPMAAGFVAARQNLGKLEERLMSSAANQLSHLDLRPKLLIDAEVPLSIFTGDIFSLIQQLEPFGQSNPRPAFLTRKVEVVERRNFGNQNKYLELKLKQGDIIWRAVSFDAHRAQEESPPYIDIVYKMEKNFWGGEEVLELNLLDFTHS